jgi:hypothetical protein
LERRVRLDKVFFNALQTTKVIFAQASDPGRPA